MQIHGPTHVHGPQSINAPHRTQAPQPAAQSGYVTGADQLDISREADMVSRVRDIAGYPRGSGGRDPRRRSKPAPTRRPRSWTSPSADCWTKSASDLPCSSAGPPVLDLGPHGR